jgi:hypothetical protein
MSYKKQDFVNGNVLTAEQLRHIEDGISTIIEGDSTPVQLFDNTKTTANTYLNSEGAEVAISPNNQGLAWHVTDYMSVDNIDVYYYTNLDVTGAAPHSAFYDEEKNLLSVFKQTQGEKISLSIPANVKFVRFSVAVVSGICRFELSKENISFKTLIDKISNTSSFNIEDFSNYEICINGDSIETEGAGRWPVLLKQAVNFKSYKNIAIGGTRIKGEINSDERIAKIPETTNILITAGGTNDWAQNIELGSLDTLEDPETFYGAVDLYIKKVLERCPDMIVVMSSNPYGCCPGRFTSSKDVDSGTYNDINAPVRRYAQAIKEVAEYNSVYYIPLYEECGINKHNFENYLLSEYNAYGHHVYLHPSDAGAAKMVKVYLRHLQSVIQRAQE